MISVVAGIILALGALEAPMDIETAPPPLNPPQATVTEPAVGVELKKPEKIYFKEPSKKPSPQAISTPAMPSATPSPSPADPVYLPISDLNTLARRATVNIFCTSKSGGSDNPISGSGVVISPSGVILTNAHIAQYFLLRDYPQKDFLNCVIRAGDTARPAYKAGLLYISSAWVDKNFSNISKQSPTGTGEHDYAFLKITETIPDGQPVTGGLPYLDSDLEYNELPKQLPVFLASYPAGFLSGSIIQTNLGMVTTVGYVKDIFTFSNSSGHLDEISLGGSIIAQAGSSGGAVVDERTGKLIGIFVTSTLSGTTDERNLSAVTTPYIKRDFTQATAKDLLYAFANPDVFKEIFPDSEFERLKAILVGELGK